MNESEDGNEPHVKVKEELNKRAEKQDEDYVMNMKEKEKGKWC